MTELYLIRHCECYGNIHRRMDGIRDTDVTPKGLRQIEQLKKRFEDLRPDALYASDLIRAQKTAAGLLRSSGQELLLDPLLRERKMGIFEGKNWHALKELYPEVFSTWRTDENDYVLPEGESASGATRRFKERLLALCAKHAHGCIVVVAHSMVIRGLLFNVLDDAPRGYADNTSVSLLKVDAARGIWQPVYLNCNSHLTPELSGFSGSDWWKAGHYLEDYSLLFADSSGRGALPEGFTRRGEIVKGYSRGELVAAGAYEKRGETFAITGLFTFPEHRRFGYATQITGEILYRAARDGARALTFSGGGDGAVSHYLAKNGFTSMDGTYVLTICASD